MSKLYFTESQKFTQIWIWVILLAAIGLFVFMDVKQLIYHQAVGNHPMSDTGLLIFNIFPLLMVVLFISLRLETEITGEGIRFRFLPFQVRFKIIRWNEIEKAYVRKYRPLMDYGGWGIRFGVPSKGRAYNIRGNMGLQLELKNNKKILIGTQKSDEMERALSRYRKDTEGVIRDF
jgi:hypothetical protein